jgi:dynein intermediate chain 1
LNIIQLILNSKGNFPSGSYCRYWAFKADDAQDDLRAIANGTAGSAYSSQTQLAELSAEPVEVQTQSAPIKDRFNFSQRATQTVDNPHRQRATNTEPPPQRTFSENLNQWVIFDAYTEDALQKEKGSKEKEKQKAATSGKTNKDQKNATLPPVEGHTDEGIHKSTELKKVLTIVERMANQNTFDDICQDFKYWEDNSDALASRKGIFDLLLTR